MEIAPLSFTVVGTPAPQGSKRHVGGGRMIESSARVKPWRDTVATAALEALAAREPGTLFGRGIPVAVKAQFWMPPTIAAEKAFAKGNVLVPATRPDIDKLVRALFDALSGIVFADDGQVHDLSARKNWAVGGRHPGVDVAVSGWGCWSAWDHFPAAAALEVAV